MKREINKVIRSYFVCRWNEFLGTAATFRIITFHKKKTTTKNSIIDRYHLLNQ